MSQATYCANHPGRETSLRCNRCEKYICPACAVRTPTGYRCKECVRDQQKIFITAEWYDYLLGFAAAAVLSFLSSLLVTLISGIAGIFAWFVIAAGAPTAAVIMAEAIRRITRKHRSRPLFITIAAGVVLGALPTLIYTLITFNVFGLIFQGIYLLMATPIVYARLSGIQLTR